MYKIMKKIILLASILTIISSTALASEQFIERFYAFSNRDSDSIAEVNYYLEKGGSIISFQTLQRGEDGTFTTMAIKIPKIVFVNERYSKN